MRHNFTVTGEVYSLRPIENGDAQFVVELRNCAELGKYIHRGAQSSSEQLKWLETYYARANDYYFVVEKKASQVAEGLIALYDVDETQRSAEWGRWLLKPASLAATESAFLIYQFAFDVLSLNQVYCRTVDENRAVVSFHDSCGLKRTAKLANQFVISGKSYDAVEHSLTASDWPKIKTRLHAIISRFSRRKKPHE